MKLNKQRMANRQSTAQNKKKESLLYYYGITGALDSPDECSKNERKHSTCRETTSEHIKPNAVSKGKCKTSNFPINPFGTLFLLLQPLSPGGRVGILEAY